MVYTVFTWHTEGLERPLRIVAFRCYDGMFDAAKENDWLGDMIVRNNAIAHHRSVALGYSPIVSLTVTEFDTNKKGLTCGSTLDRQLRASADGSSGGGSRSRVGGTARS